MHRLLSVPLFCAAALLAGCDLTGSEAADKVAALREADGKAVGSACRHAGRAIEDCYLLNPKAQRAAVFAGWREMDEYMRENKLEAVVPALDRPAAKAPDPAEPPRSEAAVAAPPAEAASMPRLKPRIRVKPDHS
ncbi:hypothetical protein [uncultured Methylibium sp.]|uniref:hypothetical protein n=1 Tax=uncultured Methylibium sp. TaxID=381093 RepID=UPI0025DFCD40|nr:hypothetical protein [uncultured Methylibium sp.]